MSDMNQNTQNMLLDWDDTIENDGQEFVILPEGDYNFTVTSFERSRHPGSAKLPACNKASLTLQVKTDQGIANCFTDLFLYRTMEWKLSQFFRCIGQKQKGQRLVMDWNRVIGSIGRAHFKPTEYVDRDGNTKTKNEVERFLDYDEKYFSDVRDGFVKVSETEDDLPFY